MVGTGGRRSHSCYPLYTDVFPIFSRFAFISSGTGLPSQTMAALLASKTTDAPIYIADLINRSSTSPCFSTILRRHQRLWPVTTIVNSTDAVGPSAEAVSRLPTELCQPLRVVAAWQSCTVRSCHHWRCQGMSKSARLSLSLSLSIYLSLCRPPSRTFSVCLCMHFYLTFCDDLQIKLSFFTTTFLAFSHSKLAGGSHSCYCVYP